MTSAITSIINRLEPLMGDLARDFVAIELTKIDTECVEVSPEAAGMEVRFPKGLPDLSIPELGALLKNIADAITILFGPYKSRDVIRAMLNDIWG